MKRIKFKALFLISLSSFLILSGFIVEKETNNEPLKTKFVYSDVENFWTAFDKAGNNFNEAAFDKFYIKKGSKGLKGFQKNRIQNAKYLSKVVKKYAKYYSSIRESTTKIPAMKDKVLESLVNLKKLYPEAVFPPIYFVVGALNSGGTTSNNGIIIGAEMYGLTPETPKEELGTWLKSVLKSVDEIPHIVAHEVIHIQQNYNGNNLLSKSLLEGSADFLAELISGKHINHHVHEFANQRETELWKEFKGRMLKKNYQGWLYSSQEGRPNDLGYWMGYKITKSYYDNAKDKQKAISDILNIKNPEKFLEDSKYCEKF